LASQIAHIPIALARFSLAGKPYYFLFELPLRCL
jgi:hypothetical protein